jgi:hypothetical protein
MLTIRCTHKLLKRLGTEALPEPGHPTNRLGDWYANLVFTRHSRLIICVSERSLLPVLVEARDFPSFIARFQEAVRSVLRHIGAASELLDSEAREMDQITIGATVNRRVLGSLNDLASLARFTMAERATSTLPRSQSSSRTRLVRRSINYETPRTVSLALLSRAYS